MLMPARGSFQKSATVFVVFSMLASTSAAAAARTVDPLVALSVFGTSQSRAAVCSAGAQAAAVASVAIAAQTSASKSCVLPVVDAPSPVANETLPQSLAAAPAPGVGTVGAFPLLLGLTAIAAAAATFLIFDDEKDGRINLPISPA
jgi:hypothetical protein